MKLPSVLVIAMICSTTSSFAQSLKISAPAPLQAGINKSTVDNFVGNQYWFFTGEPGPVHVHASFASMGLMGNPYRCPLTFTLSDEANTWHSSKTLSSDSSIVDCQFDADLKKPTKVIVTVAPPAGGLIRMGGTYQLEVSGNVAFGEASTADPIIGTYKQMGGYTSLLGACKFLPDGTIETTSGAGGRWKLFDKDSQTYVVDIEGQSRHSLQFMSGRGLLDGDMIIFQALK